MIPYFFLDERRRASIPLRLSPSRGRSPHTPRHQIVVVTHDVGHARRLAQDVVFLHHGRVIEHQAAKSFFDHPQSEAARAFVAGGLVL